MAKRKALGRGLSALIPEANGMGEREASFFHCPVESIKPNPLQPRQDFSSTELDEMAQSVREKGIITPLLVTRTASGYQLIAGERRWRAAQKAGIHRVPVVVESTIVGLWIVGLVSNGDVVFAGREVPERIVAIDICVGAIVHPRRPNIEVDARNGHAAARNPPGDHSPGFQVKVMVRSIGQVKVAK